MSNETFIEEFEAYEQKMRDATGHLLDLRSHIITRLDEGYGMARPDCTVPQHLEPLYAEFLHLVGVARSEV